MEIQKFDGATFVFGDASIYFTEYKPESSTWINYFTFVVYHNGKLISSMAGLHMPEGLTLHGAKQTLMLTLLNYEP